MKKSHLFLSRPISVLVLLAFLITLPCLESMSDDGIASGMHALNAPDSLEKIDVAVFYYVPRDREPLDDWRERIDDLMVRTQKFHRREFTGQSDFQYTIHPAPFIASAASSGFPQEDANQFYWHIINEVRQSGEAQSQAGAFPIILVFSDHNFSPGYDDWTRECDGKGCLFPAPHSDCAGYVRSNGEDRPGSRCGGARSVFWPEEHIGLGLVTADGWRVPLKGSDCVVYHEGIGHSIGLPHPEPINNSVMGLAQYEDGLHKAWVDEDQKLELGWKKEPIDHTDLFSNFIVEHEPHRPIANQPVLISAAYPDRFKDGVATAEYQTGLRLPFQKLEPIAFSKKGGQCRVVWKLPPLDQGECIAYRVRLQCPDGGSESTWHYLKVR
ncbi:MAG: hypothetical protein JXR73_18715 [Candidatus Omnitrophica bacterium]|nr:hypothetical protein [Candidatus Omnitrophota bacterium]